MKALQQCPVLISTQENMNWYHTMHTVTLLKENSMEEVLDSASLGLYRIELLSKFFPTSVHAIGIWNLNAGLSNL